MEIHFNMHSKKQGDGRQSILICFTGSDGQQKLFTGHTTEKSLNRYLGFDADAVIEEYRAKSKFMKVS